MENEERQRLALNAVNIGTWDLDLIADNLVLSDAAQHLLGIEPGSFKGDKADLLNCVNADERGQVKEILTQVLDNQVETFDFSHRLADSDVLLRHRGKVIKDEMGRPVRVVCVTTRMENS